MAVGLIDSNRRPSKDPKEGWMWGSEPVDPTMTLWDTEADEPDNKDGEEHYGCVNVHTTKLRDFPNYLKRYAICEYGDLTTDDETRG